ncbi:MAG TPA: hypothetical protein VN873_16420 [Candidatus Angelobacter sp.]|nr:hypothetical protein [Candidatus Angelobacter sp.]
MGNDRRPVAGSGGFLRNTSGHEERSWTRQGSVGYSGVKETGSISMTREEILELIRTPNWRWGTFEGAELHTLLIGLTTTFREKLEWLEEAETLILEMRAARENMALKEAESSKKER